MDPGCRYDAVGHVRIGAMATLRRLAAAGGWREPWVAKQEPEGRVCIRNSRNHLLEILAEVPEHIAAVLVDVFGGRGGAVFGEHAVACFEGTG